jgi:hypothetical protein
LLLLCNSKDWVIWSVIKSFIKQFTNVNDFLVLSLDAPKTTPQNMILQLTFDRYFLSTITLLSLEFQMNCNKQQHKTTTTSKYCHWDCGFFFVEVHKGMKPFKCSVKGCCRRFVKRESLEKHIQTFDHSRLQSWRLHELSLGLNPSLLTTLKPPIVYPSFLPITQLNALSYPMLQSVVLPHSRLDSNSTTNNNVSLLHTSQLNNINNNNNNNNNNNTTTSNSSITTILPNEIVIVRNTEQSLTIQHTDHNQSLLETQTKNGTDLPQWIHLHKFKTKSFRNIQSSLCICATQNWMLISTCWITQQFAERQCLNDFNNRHFFWFKRSVFTIVDKNSSPWYNQQRQQTASVEWEFLWSAQASRIPTHPWFTHSHQHFQSFCPWRTLYTIQWQ